MTTPAVSRAHAAMFEKELKGCETRDDIKAASLRHGKFLFAKERAACRELLAKRAAELSRKGGAR